MEAQQSQREYKTEVKFLFLLCKIFYKKRRNGDIKKIFFAALMSNVVLTSLVGRDFDSVDQIHKFLMKF